MIGPGSKCRSILKGLYLQSSKLRSLKIEFRVALLNKIVDFFFEYEKSLFVFILVSLLLNSAVFGHSKFNLCVFQALLLFSQAKDSKKLKKWYRHNKSVVFSLILEKRQDQRIL